jgi:hypothetical protein
VDVEVGGDLTVDLLEEGQEFPWPEGRSSAAYKLEVPCRT